MQSTLGHIYLEQGLALGNITTCLDLARAYAELGKLEMSTSLYEKVIQSWPAEVSAYFELTLLYKSQHGFPLARGLLLRAVELKPNWRAPFEELANMQEVLGEPEVARKTREAGKNLPEALDN